MMNEWLSSVFCKKQSIDFNEIKWMMNERKNKEAEEEKLRKEHDDKNLGNEQRMNDKVIQLINILSWEAAPELLEQHKEEDDRERKALWAKSGDDWKLKVSKGYRGWTTIELFHKNKLFILIWRMPEDVLRPIYEMVKRVNGGFDQNEIEASDQEKLLDELLATAAYRDKYIFAKSITNWFTEQVGIGKSLVGQNASGVGDAKETQ